ncbi:hypothetical protein TPA0909_60900 [Streptomyces albus]|nr:hypothetical protein TPA0909_05060 [Streptomyces albus]GHJ22102.1 hypothetical protein TPA0909_37160 [Streptomyces albus]GHJ24476.1 hypothetical protein TPA0909_60900 [Streptomyces albus]
MCIPWKFPTDCTSDPAREGGAERRQSRPRGGCRPERTQGRAAGGRLRYRASLWLVPDRQPAASPDPRPHCLPPARPGTSLPVRPAVVRRYTPRRTSVAVHPLFPGEWQGVVAGARRQG